MPLRVPPWEAEQRVRPVVVACDAAFRPWLVGPPRCVLGMKPSKFETRVLDVLAVCGVPVETVAREVMLPVGVDLWVRRFLEDKAAGCFHQSSPTLNLRLDIAWLGAGGRLHIVEVDGSQHGQSQHFFTESGSAHRAKARDAIKEALIGAACREANIRFLRVGPEYERDTHSTRTELLRFVMRFVRGENAAGCASQETGDRDAPLPDPAWAAKTREALRLRQDVRSRSAPRKLARGKDRSLVEAEETRRKQRTVYNRLCKEDAKRRLHGEALEEQLRRIKSRQVANDTRKRPRDDTGHPYELRWQKRAHNELTRRLPASGPPAC
jgi:hypothetical protein